MIKRSKCKRIIVSRAWILSTSIYRLSRTRKLKPFLGSSGLISWSFSRSGSKSLAGSMSG